MELQEASAVAAKQLNQIFKHESVMIVSISWLGDPAGGVWLITFLVEAGQISNWRIATLNDRGEIEINVNAIRIHKR